MNRFLLSIAIILCAVPFAAHAFDVSQASGRFGVAIVNNSEDSAPSPVLNTLGGSVELSFKDDYFLTLEPGLDLMWTNYEWYDGRRAAPTPAETGGGNNVFVLGLLMDVPVVFSFPIADRFSAAVSVGTAFLLRISMPGDTTAGYETQMADNLSKVSTYFWQAGRWWYPSASIRLNVWLQEGFTFALAVRGFLPLFNAWTKDAPFWDAAILHATLSMYVRL